MTDTVSKEIEPDEIVTATINDNGQIYLGRDLGGKEVVVAYEVVGETSDDAEVSCPNCGSTSIRIDDMGGHRNAFVCDDCETTLQVG